MMSMSTDEHFEELRVRIGQTEERLTVRIAQTEDRLRQTEERLMGHMRETEERLVEQIRDTQTEIIRVFMDFQQRNESRATAQEKTTALLGERVASLEHRLLEIERKLLPNQ